MNFSAEDKNNDFLIIKSLFIKELIPRDARVHYRPQFTFVYDNENNKFADFIIRYENLNEDIHKMNEKYSLKIKVYKYIHIIYE